MKNNCSGNGVNGRMSPLFATTLKLFIIKTNFMVITFIIVLSTVSAYYSFIASVKQNNLSLSL